MVFLLGSRYCETDRLSETAWRLFGTRPPAGRACRPSATSSTTTSRFGYEHASPTKTAWEVFQGRRGVCRDYAHLAVAFCRCMNIPARYCTGYLGDIGVPPPYAPMDFAGLVRGLPGRWLVHLRSAQQHAAHRPHPDRPRSRRRGRRDQHHLRPQHPAELSRLDRSNQSVNSAFRARYHRKSLRTSLADR